MDGLITWESVTFIIALGGVAFGVYHFFRNPDVNADKRLCLLESLFKLERERSDVLLEMDKNHLHSIEVTQQMMTGEIVNMGIKISKLETIIDERIPRIIK